MNLNAGLVVNAEAFGGSSFSFLRNIFPGINIERFFSMCWHKSPYCGLAVRKSAVEKS